MHLQETNEQRRAASRPFISTQIALLLGRRRHARLSPLSLRHLSHPSFITWDAAAAAAAAAAASLLRDYIYTTDDRILLALRTSSINARVGALSLPLIGMSHHPIGLPTGRQKY